MRKIVAAIAAAVMSLTLVLSAGCVNLTGVDGRDGKDGQDVSVYDCYELAKQENPDLTVDDFLKEYLSYSKEDFENSFSLQTAINGSLRSGVSIMSVFKKSGFDIFSRPVTQTSAAYGAGVIVDLDKESGNAYVVTNCHVIYEQSANNPICDNVSLFLYGMDENYNNPACAISATVIGASQTYDIALLKVENSEILKSSDAVAAKFSSNDDVYMGEEVYAVGNPQGYGMSATKGIISKESETIQINLSSSQFYQNVKEYRVIRTDAAINGGNSGGGLYNSKGELVGIVNAKSSESTVDNMGFALPSGNVRRLVRLMLDNYTSNGFSGNKGVTRAYLKAEYAASPRTSKWNNLKGVYEVYESVYVTNEGDGLLEDDSIRNIKILNSDGEVIENREVTRIHHLDDTLLSARVGYKAIITVSRGGSETDVEIPITSAHFLTLD